MPFIIIHESSHHRSFRFWPKRRYRVSLVSLAFQELGAEDEVDEEVNFSLLDGRLRPFPVY